MQVIYKNEYDKQNFDKERYRASLERYGEIDSTEFEKVVKEKLEPFPIRHVSCLVREAIPVFKNEEDARKYYEEHKGESREFDRLRRITGYLVGSLSRWGTPKRSEEAARVKHSLPGQYTLENKQFREKEKRLELDKMQI